MHSAWTRPAWDQCARWDAYNQKRRLCFFTGTCTCMQTYMRTSCLALYWQNHSSGHLGSPCSQRCCCRCCRRCSRRGHVFYLVCCEVTVCARHDVNLSKHARRGKTDRDGNGGGRADVGNHETRQTIQVAQLGEATEYQECHTFQQASVERGNGVGRGRWV